MTNLIQNVEGAKIILNWDDDGRESEPDGVYHEARSKQSRMRAFLAGWEDFLRNGTSANSQPQQVTWDFLGMWCGEKYGNVPMEFRRGLYILHLQWFLSSPACDKWTEKQRNSAILLAASEAIRLHFDRD